MRARSLPLLLAAGACLAATPLAAQPAADDTAPAAGTDIVDTLREALAMTYRTNPTLLAARSNQRATDENVPIQRAGALPSLSATGNATQTVYDSADSGSPVRSATASLSLGVPLYAGGGVRNGIRAAETRVLAGRADLRGTESAVFSQAVSAYMEVIYQEALVSLAASNVQVLEVNLQATSDRFEIGDLTRTDVAQSEARLSVARGQLRTTQANLVRARENYIVVVGAAPGDLKPPPPLPGLPGDPDTAVDVAMQDNPDLLAANERAKAAGYDIGVSRANRLPTVSATAGADYQTFLGTLPGGTAGVLSNDSSGATAGLRATLPIFQGGRAGALIRQSQARQSVALENAVATERDVIATVRAAYSSWQASNEIIVSSQAAVDAAALSLEGVRAENTVGNRTILDVLNAQQELLNARVNLITAQRDRVVASYSVVQSIGRLSSRSLGLNVAQYSAKTHFDQVKDLWFGVRTPDGR